MKLPCQRIVWDVLPAIKAAIAEELVNCGLSQQEVARELEMAPSAISQYLSKKRGYRIVLEDEDIKDSIHSLAEDIKEGKAGSVPDRICGICKALRDDGQKCEND
ncbi:MAG: transcriptional regulator [Methanolobus sp.]